MDRVFDTVVDRTRSRLDVPLLRTLFGAKARPHRDRSGGPPRLAVVIETPRYDLTLFKVHFGLLTLKGYTKDDMRRDPLSSAHAWCVTVSVQEREEVSWCLS
jgi:hypothetical protein